MAKIDLEKLKKMTVSLAHEAFLSGEFTPVDLVEAYLEQIKIHNKDVNAYLEVYDDVLLQAKSAEKKISDMIKAGNAKDIPMLCGIPCAVKDNILVKGRIASASSKMLEEYTATYDATAITKLRELGVVFVGRTNMDEFAMGGSTENSTFGPTKNPLDLSRVAGGSSGGSAAALSMYGALIALGTDTGGSVRQPASFNGVVGLKPTYGAVSRYGIMAMGSSLDQVGPFGRTVTDTEILFDAIRGKDEFDSTTISADTYSSEKHSSRKVIGVPRHFLGGDGIKKEVLENFNQSLEKFKKLGYEIIDVELPNISYSLAAYYIIMPAEVSSNLARFDGVKYGYHKDGKNGVDDYFETRADGFGREVRRRILLGTYVLSSGYYDAYYNRANALRRLIRSDFEKAFEKVDIIMTPTTPAPAFALGEKTADPVAMYLEDIFTVTANLTGMPAMSIPSGKVDALPLGIQLTAMHGGEKRLFQVGKEFLSE